MDKKTEKPKSSFKNEDINSASLLVIVFDTNPSQRLLRENPANLTQILESIITFGNAHLMQKSANKLAVLSCHHHSTDFLYPVPKSIKKHYGHERDGQYINFLLVERTIKQRLGEIICDAPKLNAPVDSLLAGSISMALSYIARIQRSVKIGSSLRSRILVVTASVECSSQYLTYMSNFFTAQKLGISIDCCTLDRDLTLLQQGCDITGGQYFRLTQLEGFLQYLIWIFLPDQHIRNKFVLPPPAKVDYRAACFCHRELINIGYVCSVCLSIYCKYVPICTTCQTIFPSAQPTKLKKKKKA